MKTNEQIAAYVFAARDEQFRKQSAYKKIITRISGVGLAAAAVAAMIFVGTLVRDNIEVTGDTPSTVMLTGVVTTYPAAYIPETGNAVYLDTDTGMQMGWNDMPAYDKYREFTHEGMSYRGFRLKDGTGIVPEKNVGEKLYDVTMSTIETFSEKEFRINAEVFAINNISTEYAVAVKYEGTDEYCSFRRGDCCPPANIGELIDAFDLTETVSFGDIFIPGKNVGNEYYTYKPIPLNYHMTQTMLELLQECRDIPSDDNEDANFSHQLFSITTSVPSAGIDYKSIWFTEDGYMMTNIMEYAFCFNIGTERVQRLAEAFKISEQTPHIRTFPELPQTTVADDYYGEETSIGTVVMYTQSAAYEPDITTVEE
ncbi:MAG: hypothetical protein J6N15_13140 [Ruminiclostridium sp.]|nr:hypothetical protein [Ruminiclostridium sp.]